MNRRDGIGLMGASAFILLITLASYAYLNAPAAESRTIDGRWVSALFQSIDSYRTPTPYWTNTTFQHTAFLDEIAQQRLKAMLTCPEIAHCPGNYSEPGGIGEEVLYPDGFTPQEYVADLRSNAPLHWNPLVQTYAFYGFAIGIGTVYASDASCPVTEIPSQGINVPQYLQQNGCTVTVSTGTWLVIELQ